MVSPNLVEKVNSTTNNIIYYFLIGFFLLYDDAIDEMFSRVNQTYEPEKVNQVDDDYRVKLPQENNVRVVELKTNRNVSA